MCILICKKSVVPVYTRRLPIVLLEAECPPLSLKSFFAFFVKRVGVYMFCKSQICSISSLRSLSVPTLIPMNNSSIFQSCVLIILFLGNVSSPYVLFPGVDMYVYR